VTTNDSTADILSVIRRIDSAWREGPPDEIVARVTPLLDPDVVFCDNNFQPVARGASVCAASYEGFVRMATVREFSAPDPQIHVAGDTAMAVCPWTMTYTLKGENYTESGHALVVFNRAGGEWRVMWRAMVPASS
jgi:ketosteroid isomerase-like protein